MQAEYKRDMNHNYLVLHAEKEVDTASYQVRMLVGNSIPSLLKCRVQGMDGTFLIYYEITSKQSLASLFEEKKLDYQDLQLVFGGFMQTLEEMSEYLLNPGRLVIRPEYMFVDAEKRELYFCYLPDYERDVRQQFQELTEYILPKLDHRDQKAVMLGYGVYRRALEDSFRLEYIKEELYRDCMEEGVKETKQGTNRNEPLYGNQSQKFSEQAAPDRKIQEKPWSSEEAKADWNAEEDFFAFRGEKMEKNGKNAEDAREERLTFRKKLAACIAGAVLLLGVFGAKFFGYLPQISLEYLLAGILGLTGIGLLIYTVFQKEKKKAQPETWRQRRISREEENMEWEKKEEPEWNQAEKNLQPGEEAIKEMDNFIEKKCDKSKKTSYIKGKRMEQDKKEAPGADNFGETTVLSAGDLEGPATLVSREPGELATIYLQEELTVIGKLENAADAVISLPTVSRVHAKIRCRDGEYYLSDLNSRNGTSVNGKMLLPDQEYCLQDQDQVDFAQARYVFIR